jgi:hypothetical protein
MGLTQIKSRFKPANRPDEYLMNWLKDTYDYQRSHSDEELRASLSFTHERIFVCLQETAEFVWEAKKAGRW